MDNVFVAKSSASQSSLPLSSAEAEGIAAMSFEQALKALEDIVRRLESGSGDLEAALGDYARGTALKEHCQEKLAEARLKVEAIMKTADGVSTAPADIS